MFSGISLKQLIVVLYRAIADIAAKLYVNSNSDTLPEMAIAGYSDSYSGRFKTILNLHDKIIIFMVPTKDLFGSTVSKFRAKVYE